MATLEVQAEDVIKLIIQYLKESGLHNSVRVLQEESQVSLNTVDNAPKFQQDILHGRWDAVLEAASTLKLRPEKMWDLFEQMIFELAELREVDTAKAVLRQTAAMTVMKKEAPERYLRLEHLLQKTYFESSEAYPPGVTKEKRRQQLADALKDEVVVVPPSRLLGMLNQALKWQQLQGMLPKGSKYDLFRGQAVTAAAEEEKPPEKNVKVIKSPTKSHRECAQFSPDGQYLATGSSDGYVELYDFESGKLATDLKYQAEDDLMAHDQPVIALTFSRDSELIASGDAGGAVKVWKLKTGSCVRKFPQAHTKGVTHVDFARDGTQLLTASMDGSIRLHGLKSGRTLKEFKGHKSFVNCAIFTEDGDRVISASSDGTVKVWDAKSTDCLKTWRPNPSAANNPSVTAVMRLPTPPKSNSADRILVCTREKHLRVMTLDGQVTSAYTITGQGDVLTCGASPKAGFLYAVSEDCVLYCFASDDPTRPQAMIKVHEKDCLGVAHHPHRNIVATWSQDGTLKLWKP